jgi:phosphoribosylpyrophosphate synthetase
MAKKIIFCCPQMFKLAMAVAQKNSEFRVGIIRWQQFEDGFPNLFIEDVEEVKNSEIYFFASLDCPAEIFRQLAVMSAFWLYEAKTLTVILPFLPTATMERIDKPGEVATAKTLARLLSSIPACSGGFPKIISFDPHVQSLPFYFERNSVFPVALSAMSLAKDGLRRINETAVAFPDAGAKKRFGRLFSEYPQIVCDKIRQGGERIVTIKEGDPADKYVLIVDDLTRTGKTLDKCREALVMAGARAVSAFVTHGVFATDVWKKFVYEGEFDPQKHFQYFLLTDSCPLIADKVRGHQPFKVLSLADLIYDAIKE